MWLCLAPLSVLLLWLCCWVLFMLVVLSVLGAVIRGPDVFVLGAFAVPRYGSANILWLAMTVMVPLANFSFALKFMPNRKGLTWEDGVGLAIIMAVRCCCHLLLVA